MTETFEDFLASAEVTLVRMDRSLFERGFDLYKTHLDKTWGFIDCLSFVVMKERGIVDALTTDDDFRQARFNPLFQQRGTA
ncbi:MAG: hypothetical protein HYZ50_04470 [Deltaproteobacteria bacterium]|nr:hypothetical protein [Deltaproteobacteria bacterium]